MLSFDIRIVAFGLSKEKSEQLYNVKISRLKK